MNTQSEYIQYSEVCKHSVTEIIEHDLTAASHAAMEAGVDIDALLRKNVLEYGMKVPASQVPMLSKKHSGKGGCIINQATAKNGLTYPVIVFSNFSQGGITATYSAYVAAKELADREREYTKSLTPDESKRRSQELEAKRVERVRELEIQENEKAKSSLKKRAWSLKSWSKMRSLTVNDQQYSYLLNKKLTFALDLFRFGADKALGEFIAYPLYDARNIENLEQVGYERISLTNKAISAGSGADGAVYFGCVGVINKEDPIIITEGFADALSLNRSTGFTCLSACSCTNMQRLYRELIKQGCTNLTIATDADEAGDKLFFSDKFLGEVEQLAMLRPPVAIGSNEKDWNDVYVRLGAEGVCNRIDSDHGMSVRTNVNQRYMSPELVEKSMINLIISEKGTGKTTMLREAIPENASVLVVSFRRLIIDKLSEDLGFHNYQDTVGGVSLSAVADRIVISPESLSHIPQDKHFDYVVIDEVEQTLDHIARSSTVRNRDFTYQLLRRLTARANTVVMMDADLSTLTHEMLVACNPRNLPFNVVNNAYLPRKARKDRVFVYSKAITVQNKCFHESKSAPVFCFSDSRNQVTELHTAIMEKKEGASGLLFTSETREEALPLIPELTKNVMDMDIVSCSPSAQAGVSIDEGHPFKKGFGIFTGRTAGCDANRQLMARVRELGEYHVAITATTNEEDEAVYPTSWRELFDMIVKEPLKRSGDTFRMYQDLTDEPDFTARLVLKARAKANFDRKNHREQLIKGLKKEGFDVVIVDDSSLLPTSEVAQAVADAKASTKAQKQAKREEKRVSMVEYLSSISDKCSDLELLTELEVTKSITKKVSHLDLLKVDEAEAEALDRSELEQLKSGKKSQISLSHHTDKRKMISSILELVGIEYQHKRGFVQSRDFTVRTDSEEMIASIQRFFESNDGQFATHLNIAKKTDYSANTLKRFKELLLSVGVVLETKRLGGGKIREISVTESTIGILNDVHLMKDRISDFYQAQK